MTLIAIWSDDPKKHLYLATDSRLSDVSGAGTCWDRACKIFQTAHLPEVIAYCGKTEPLLVAISQTAQCLRYADVLAQAGTDAVPQLTARVSAACRHLDQAVKSYPAGWMGVGGNMFFGGYDHRLHRPRVFQVDVNTKGVKANALGKVYDQNEVALHQGPKFFGSGKSVAEGYLMQGKAPFDCLKSAILSGKDKSVGGIPQVVRISEAGVTPIGIVWDGQIPFLSGMECHYHSAMHGVEWRDKGFNVCEYPRQARVRRIVRRGRR